MSSDWSSKYVSGLFYYLTNIYVDCIDKNKIYNIIRPKWRKAIEKLSEFDEKLVSNIENGTSYTINISLDEIYKLIPMYERKSKYYYPLISYLKKLGVDLRIISERLR